MKKRKPKTQSGFASFDMQEFAEMLVIGTNNKPKQNGLLQQKQTANIIKYNDERQRLNK